MQVTEVRIRVSNEEFVKAYASICLDDYFLVHDIRIIKRPAGLFISFPNVTKRWHSAGYCFSGQR
jgi:DNA-binding cell septation regulator SpoVG